MAILRRKPEDCLSIELNLGDGGRVPAVFPGSTVYGRIRCPATQYTDRGVSLDLTGEEGVEHADGCFSYLGNKKFNRKVKLFLNGFLF